MEKTIDLDVILKNKKGDKAKWVPSPLVNWLKRVIHQDQVNAFLWESRELTGTPWLEACVKYLEMTLKVEGKENAETYRCYRRQLDGCRLIIRKR